MEPRLNVATASSAGYAGLQRVEKYLSGSPLDHVTLELVKLRASQINGCGFCMDMHAHDALAAGESLDRLFVVAGWREAPGFTEPERVALELTEALTRMADRADAVPDELWARVEAHYDDEQRAALLLAIATINAWNRIAVASRLVPGSMRP